GLTVLLFRVLPTDLVPEGDIGLVRGSARAAPDISFEGLESLQKKINEIIADDPDVEGVGGSIGGASGFGAANRATFFMALKPFPERKTPARAVIARLDKKLSQLKEVDIKMFPGSELQFGGRQSRGQYQVTIWSPELKDIVDWLPKIQDRVKRVPGVAGV